jgi:two-component system cell cycle sensor histidine kinase/response regulator CckA
VKQSGGYIWAESKVRCGSSFHTLLPRVPEPSASCVVQDELDFRSGSETILLVEDDPAVRKMAAEVLRNAGSQALVAPSGDDALRLAGEHRGMLDLLLTEVVMSGITGPELADRFAADFPRIHVLYMSGYTDDALGNHDLRGQTRHVLQKPFTLEMLVRRVYEALEPFRRS